MPMQDHATALLTTLTIALVLAFALGLLAHRLRVPPLAGYLLAGIAIGPFTPGFVADREIAAQFSEIGIVLLLFGIGLHFTPRDLAAVARVAIPAALAQLLIIGALGAGLAALLGWSGAAGLIFGLALAVASTVVQMRAMQDRRLLETSRGHLAMGWLIFEDLAMVLALVMLPALGRDGGAAGDGLTAGLIALGKTAAFLVLMLVVGRRAIPALLHYTAHTGSRELFRLSVLATALGFALVAAQWFSASLALGAFCAGIVLGESPLSQRAADEALPLRDAFAVLFFVSVGMLFRPAVLVEQPLAVLATVAIIVLAKPLVTFAVLRMLGRKLPVALTLAAGRGQIGEFSFVLAGSALAEGVLPAMGQDLILSGAILSILANPLLFAGAERWLQRHGPAPSAAETSSPAPAPAEEPEPALDLAGHDIVAGYGRVGSRVAADLLARGRDCVVLDLDGSALEQARAAGARTLTGNAADPDLLRRAALGQAARVFVTLPDPFEAGQIVEQARRAVPSITIFARAHSDADEAHLTALGASRTIMGEREIADRMLELSAPAKG